MPTSKPPKTLLQAAIGLWRSHRAPAIVLGILMAWSLGLTAFGVVGSHMLDTPPPPYHAQVRLLAGQLPHLPYTLHRGHRYGIRVDVQVQDRALPTLSLVFVTGRSFSVADPSMSPGSGGFTPESAVGPVPYGWAFSELDPDTPFEHVFGLTPARLGTARLVVIAYSRLNSDGTVDLSSYAGLTVWDGVVVP